MKKVFSGICAVGGYLMFRKLYWTFYRNYFKLPNGSVGYPFIGSLPNLYLNTSNYLQSINKQYGDISLLYVGFNNLVLLNNTKLFKQIVSNKSFLLRPVKSKRNTRVNRKVRPFPFINGDEWKLRRKNFSTSIITMLQSNTMNDIISKVLKNNIFPEINKRINKQNNIGIIINDLCHLAVFNTLYYAAFGHQISIKDKNYQIIKKWIHTIFAEKNPFDPGRFNKIFRYLMGLYDNEYKKNTNEMIKAIKNKKNIFLKLIQNKLDTFDEHKLEGFVDHMVFNMKNNKQITFDMILDDIGTVFTAGTDTTSSMIEVIIYNFVLFPGLQQKVYQEIKQQTINNKTDYFELKMQAKCPLFRAFIHEAMRLHGGVVSPARTCKKDTLIDYNNKTYMIPKNSIIMLSQDGATMNTKSNNNIWGENVNQFDIKRFLTKDNKFKYNDSFPIFSFGRRDCPGRSLANKNITLMVANMLLNYKFKPFNNDIKKFKHDFKKNKKIYSVYKFDPALKLFINKRCQSSPLLLQQSISIDVFDTVCCV